MQDISVGYYDISIKNDIKMLTRHLNVDDSKLIIYNKRNTLTDFLNNTTSMYVQ